MANPPIRRLDKVKDVEVGLSGTERDAILRLIKQSLLIASQLASRSIGATAAAPITLAATNAIASVAALLSVASAQCTLAAPPEPIRPRVGGSGNLVLRCSHAPAHEWDLNGKRLK